MTGVHIAADTLWLCSVDTTFMRPTEVRSFSRTGAPLATYPLPATAFCNDIAIDAAGSVYATDSFGGAIYKLAAGADAFTPLVTDARFVPDSQGAFGLDGIVLAGNALIVNKLDTGELFRVAFDGTISDIALAAPLAGPDGMRTLDANTLLVVEGGANRLSKVAIATGAVTPVTSDLDMPTGVVVARGAAWVTEGQLGRLFAQPSQAPNLPFSVRHIDL